VTTPDASGSFEIALRRVGETIPVTIRNPDGTPASGALVWAVRTTSGHERPLWQSASDRNGTVLVPRSVRGALFLVRPRGAAPAVRRLDQAEDVVWPLFPAAPLTIRTDRDARIAVWIDDIRVSGGRLMWLLAARETSIDGTWSAPAVPRRPLRVLAWRTAPAHAIDMGAYDMAATQLAYPWPGVVELRPVD
jgi:hypothetical protein